MLRVIDMLQLHYIRRLIYLFQLYIENYNTQLEFEKWLLFILTAIADSLSRPIFCIDYAAL